VNPETKSMEHPTLVKHESLATIRKIKVNHDTSHILHLPGGQRILTYSSKNGSFHVWDLERDKQFGEEWEDKERELVETIVLSPDGKKVATSGSPDGAVKLWSIDTGKIIKTLMGHTVNVGSLCWSPDGRRVVSGESRGNGKFRIWDVESGETIVGPIEAGELFECICAVCYSPDGKMIATSTVVNRSGLKIWDANTGELLKTLDRGGPDASQYWCLVWTSDGKALFAGGSDLVKKFDTATWTADIVMRERLFKRVSRYPNGAENLVNTILISSNHSILASTSSSDKIIVQLYHFETNQPIGTPLQHENEVNSATFSADGKFLISRCGYDHIYIWDIIKEAGLSSDNVSLDTFLV